MSTAPRFLGIGAVLGLAAGLLLGVGLTQPGHVAATGPSAAPTAPANAPAVGAPGALPAVTTGGTSVAQAGTAIAYPFYAGSPGLAPDHTVVVTGTGQADLSADGSNRTAAQESALAAALADARVQAQAIAAGSGLTLGGVLSVAAAVSPVAIAVTMAGSGGTICVPGAPTGGTQASGAPAVPQPVCPPQSPQSSLYVSVTVEYHIG